MTWIDYQRTLRNVLLALEPAPADVLSLGDEPDRWNAYRRMVRSRFLQTIDHGFERMIGFVGADRFHRLVDRFLAEDPPRSPYLRDVPGEFLRFVERRRDVMDEPPPLPPFALDLMRYEWAELDTAYTHQEVQGDAVVPLEMDAVAVLSPAHRLLALDYPVHRMGTDGAGAPQAPSVALLCLYRDPATHEVETLELTPVAATMLAEIARQGRPLTDVVRSAAEAHHLPVDVAFVEALSTLLADLTERGVLLGSFATTPPSPPGGKTEKSR
jgi:hypothetical protein